MPLLLRDGRRTPSKTRTPLVTVYTRAGCCCCDKAFTVLETARRNHRFTIESIDVDSDPALAALHGASVPVVAVDGKIRFRGVVNPVLLERLLRAPRAS